jgi:TolB-like protein/Flp pilus assembly protein TadD
MLLIIGFVPTLIFSWVYELTPEGVKKESEINQQDSIASHTGKRLDLVVIIMIAVAIGLFVFDRFADQGGRNEVAGSDPNSTVDPAQTASPAAKTIITPSIAVLPFANMSTDAENGYFADGISEEILNLLADVKELSVASRTSAFAFKGKDTPIPEIAVALGVNFVLEGSVRKSGEKVRVTAQLIDAGSDRHLWSETYDRTLDDIFAIQDEIAGAIGDALQIELLGDRGEQVQSEEIDPEIYALFLQARHEMRLRGEDQIRRSVAMLQQVVEAEPEFARGHVLLGEAHLLSVDSENDWKVPEASKVQARMHAKLARAINPKLAGIYLILGQLAETDVVARYESFTRAIEIEPEEPRPYHWRAILFLETGELDRAYADARKAVRLEPGNVGAVGTLALALQSMGLQQQAIVVFEQQADLGRALDFESLGFAQLAHGDLDAAEDSLDTLVAREDVNSGFYAALIDAARDPGQLPRLQQAIEQGLHKTSYTLLGALAALGRGDELMAAGQDQPESFLYAIWRPGFQEIRRDPRFQAILKSQGVTDYWLKYGAPPDCRPVGDSFECGFGYPEGYANEAATP